LGQPPVELDEIERAGWWAFPPGQFLTELLAECGAIDITTRTVAPLGI
jgi:hypothetical protein